MRNLLSEQRGLRRQAMDTGNTLLAKIEQMQDTTGFRSLHWEGSFKDYLEIVRNDPKVARAAFQRVYDMIVSYGYDEYTRNRETLVHYRFFDDPFESSKDAVFGLDKPLMELVRIFQSAAPPPRNAGGGGVVSRPPGGGAGRGGA